MSIILVIVLLVIWFYFGWLILSFANVEDHTIRGLLAPAVGMAVVTLFTTTASLSGLPIKNSVWIILLILGCSLIFFRRATWRGFMGVASINLFTLVLNFLTVGIGLIVFGLSWQGLINGDAATNSLAAQYFMGSGYFAVPSIQSISTGIDYSPLSAELYVAGKHRFGDVMLLSFSASLFNLYPDEVYMAHALAIRCTMIAVASLLIYKHGAPAWRLLVAIVLLTLSPLGAYVYLNELISQSGGLALLLAAAILLSIILEYPDNSTRKIWSLAIVISALCLTYPESISLLALGICLLGIYRAKYHNLPPIRVLIKWVAMLFVIVLVLLNYSLRNVLTHSINAVGYVAKAQGVVSPSADFGYAFTPDFFPLLLGFLGMREAIPEPWALAIQITAFALIGMLTLFAARRLDHYPLLVSLYFSTLIAFLFLFWQGSLFGTFKIMLQAQPLIFALLAALINEVIVARNQLGAIVVLVVLLLVCRGESYYIFQSMTPLGHIPLLAKIHILDKIQGIVSKAPEGILIESPNFLLGKFAMLRPKERRVTYEQKYFASFSPDIWEDGYKATIFQCAPPEIQAKFDYLTRNNEPDSVNVLVPGGQLTPLNRVQYGDIDLMLLDKDHTKDFLVFRPSSLGSHYGVTDTPSIFDLERDIFLPTRSMAAVGRYMLLEILAPTEGDVQFAIRFSRTFLGGHETRLPEITLYGASSSKLLVAGSGALSMTSLPLSPCIINGRSFVLLDIGIESSFFKKSAPFAYQLLGMPYLPDIRSLTGFMRDISVVHDQKVSHDKIAILKKQWDFEAFDSSFEYSGIFEDGWMSNHIILRPKRGLQGSKIILALDVPNDPTEKQPALLSVEINGKPVRQQPLMGRVNVAIDLSADSVQTISLIANRPYVLPRGDGRHVIGLLRSITVE